MAEYEILCFSIILFGFLIINSSSECDRGYFGWRCQLECSNCVGGKCAWDTGQCLSQCKPGYSGHHCMLADDCKYDAHGIYYTGHLSVTSKGKNCVSWASISNKHLEFQRGDDPENFCRNPMVIGDGRLNILWCYTAMNKTMGQCSALQCECPKHLFGNGCANQCHCKDKSEVCGQFGRCPISGCADGWIGRNCSVPCRSGRYGANCGQTCEKCLNQDCDHETGHCKQGCPTGFMGDSCDQKCVGNYGRNCVSKCGHCKDGVDCSPLDGECHVGCAVGYGSSNNMLVLCDESCEVKQRYGLNCDRNCGACKGGVVCNPETGVCETGCITGYSGLKCDRMCPSRRYGRDCAQSCGMCKDNATCDAFTGRCPGGCDIGHSGFDCAHKVIAESNSTYIVIGAGVAVAVAIIILIALFILYRRKRQKNLDVVYKVRDDGIENPLTSENCQLLPSPRAGVESTFIGREEDDNTKNDMQEPIYENISHRKQTSPVPVPELYDYINKNKEHFCEGFMREFEALPMGLLAKCEIARKPENKSKNRYGNIVAYDHSRVLLDPIPGELFSDYVNANFMDGYNRPKSYIASQGPNRVMIRDFWRMVWQQKVSKIVMLTNLVEACKKKCEQYWPEEGSQKYGDLTVLLVNTTKYTDFTIRTLELTKEMENSRIVMQFHFTTWSDHGAPTYPTTLLAFRKKVQNFKPDDTAPILSHCSAGIGRTGTFIALNYLLDQATAEKEVDVLHCAQLMRANRVNMIQTLEQYVFVYEAVLEAILSGSTTIPRSSFYQTYERMSNINDGESQTLMEKQYNVLQLLTPTLERDECLSALQDDNMNKNRFKNILPSNRRRPYLYTPVQGCNDYINAVLLSGYTQEDQFIVTQMPLPHTVADFWRMLYDMSSDTIVMLNEFDRNDKSCALYWPEEYGYSEEHGPLSVELLRSYEADQDVTIRIFKLSHLDKEERAIKMFQFKSWPDYQTTPPAVIPLLRLHRRVNDWLKQNSKGPVTIHCLNGASKSGVFAAMSLLVERLELDYEVDVYQTAKMIRVNRPQFIENLEQYEFLYQIVQEYMEQE